MELKRAFRLPNYPRLALVGAGGKTTALFQLAREISPPLIVTAATHLAVDQIQLADTHIILQSIEDTNQLHDLSFSGVLLLTGPIEGERTAGLSLEILSWVREYCGYHSLPLLIEADGARRRPLKGPAEHEPPIPPYVDTVVVVAGLSGLGKPLTAEWVHRPERFATLSELSLREPITPAAFSQVLNHPNGGLKNIPPNARPICLLTQTDTPELQANADQLAKDLLSKFEAVVTITLTPNNKTHSPLPTSHFARITAVHEPIAGVILAAGEAQRFGSPKQLLDWHGRPLIWHVAQNALQAGLSPVIVVGGAYTSEIKAALRTLPVEVLHNPDWQAGPGTSVGAGVRRLPARIGAGIFMLADQPQIPVGLLRQLVARHTQTLSPIVAPWVAGRRANPVLFDRDLFGELSALTADSGGRQLFSKYEVSKLFWGDVDILLDVDTPEDYQRLLKIFPARLG